MFLCLNLCLSVMLDSLSCSFTSISFLNTCNIYLRIRSARGRRGHDRMVVEFTTTCAIGVYHHWCFGFEPRSGLGVQHYVIKFVSDLWQVGGFLEGHPVSSTNKTDRHDITEILLKVADKHHKTNQRSARFPYQTMFASFNKTLNYLAFQSFNFERTWWRLF